MNVEKIFSLQAGCQFKLLIRVKIIVHLFERVSTHHVFEQPLLDAIENQPYLFLLSEWYFVKLIPKKRKLFEEDLKKEIGFYVQARDFCGGNYCSEVRKLDKLEGWTEADHVQLFQLGYARIVLLHIDEFENVIDFPFICHIEQLVTKVFYLSLLRFLLLRFIEEIFHPVDLLLVNQFPSLF